MTTVIDLPYPPTVNTLYANGKGGRFKTAAYANWQNAAGLELRRQRPEKVTGPYAISIEVQRVDKRRRDLGNLHKSLSDLLVNNGVVDDDSFEQEVHMAWSDDCTGCRVVITPMQREAA